MKEKGNNTRIKQWKKGKIIYFHRKADSQFWDDLWETQISLDYYDKFISSLPDKYCMFFEKYMSKENQIIEAGCGTARYVIALRSRGYRNVTGIDWAEETIHKVKSIIPDLPIYVGNVTSLNVEDGYYDGYISLGVVEHREEGPEPFLTEAFRIIKPGGYAFISVPYVNPLRKAKAIFGCYQVRPNSNHIFYQYAFQKKEFEQILQNTGFRIVEFSSIDGYFGIKEEFSRLFHFLDEVPGGSRIRLWVSKQKCIDFFGHMMMLVCQKPF